MNRRVVIYLFTALIIAGVVLALYFFARKPEKLPAPKLLDTEKKALVFKDVQYSGERKGAVDWELKAAVARKFMDRPVVELEKVNGTYKPKAGTIVGFKGTESTFDTETERGTMDGVEIDYNREYRLKTKRMEFDFKAGTARTGFPVDIRGPRLTLAGTGLIASTREQTLLLERAVSGVVETDGRRLNFQSDRLTYKAKEDLYILEGRVNMRGEDLDVRCDTLYLYGKENQLEKLDARGKVILKSKRLTARGENAVYYFREDRKGGRGLPKI
jgi:LPS export ABC transporter protein LptC